MNISYIISAIIGATFLTSIVLLSISMNRSSYETTYSLLTNNHVDHLQQTISYDMRYVGFGSNNEILVMNDSTFHFRAEVNGNVRDFLWSASTNTNTGTSNPNVYRVERVGPDYDSSSGTSTLTFDASNFRFFYYNDGHGNQITVDPDEVRSVRVEVTIQSSEAIGRNSDGSGRHSVSNWNRLFRPISLNL